MLFFPQILSAIQPYEAMKKAPGSFYIQQGPAMCGPTAFFLIFNYYKDNQIPSPYFFDKNGNIVDLFQPIPKLKGKMNKNIDQERLTQETKISKWINPEGNATRWSRLKEGAKNLYHKDTHGNLKNYYTIVRSNDAAISGTHEGIKTRKKILETEILPFLDKNHPVIVHLKRKGLFSGHYIVLVGYDQIKGSVFFIDPNKKNSDPVIQHVDQNRFVGKSWYKGSAPRYWGKAEWDGKWLGFCR